MIRQTINLKGPFLMIHHFIKAQPNPKEPVGTIVSVSAGLIGLTNPGFSSYSIAKLAAQRLGEFIDVGRCGLSGYRPEERPELTEHEYRIS